MPNRVELSAAAKADLADILDYGIERFGLDEAVAFRINLLEHLDHIAEYPESYAENRDLTPPAQAEVAGMDYFALRTDYDFKKAVRHVVEDCDVSGYVDGGYLYSTEISC